MLILSYLPNLFNGTKMTKEKPNITTQTFYEVTSKIANDLNEELQLFKNEDFEATSSGKTIISEKIIEGMEFVIDFTLQPIRTRGKENENSN
jgi:hypothetical protein